MEGDLCQKEKKTIPFYISGRSHENARAMKTRALDKDQCMPWIWSNSLASIEERSNMFFVHSSALNRLQSFIPREDEVQ